MFDKFFGKGFTRATQLKQEIKKHKERIAYLEGRNEYMWDDAIDPPDQHQDTDLYALAAYKEHDEEIETRQKQVKALKAELSTLEKNQTTAGSTINSVNQTGEDISPSLTSFGRC